MTDDERRKCKDLYYAQICGVVKACEESKDFIGSEYGREQAEVTAYKQIREILGITHEGE